MFFLKGTYNSDFTFYSCLELSNAINKYDKKFDSKQKGCYYAHMHSAITVC